MTVSTKGVLGDGEHGNRYQRDSTVICNLKFSVLEGRRDCKTGEYALLSVNFLALETWRIACGLACRALVGHPNVSREEFI